MKKTQKNPKNTKKLKKPKKAKKVKVEKAKNAKIAEIAENAKIAETEKVRFLETLEVWVFFGKIDGLFQKSLNFIQNLQRLQICCGMPIKWFYFSKISSTLIMRFFCKKIRKI